MSMTYSGQAVSNLLWRPEEANCWEQGEAGCRRENREEGGACSALPFPAVEVRRAGVCTEGEDGLLRALLPSQRLKAAFPAASAPGVSPSVAPGAAGCAGRKVLLPGQAARSWRRARRWRRGEQGGSSARRRGQAGSARCWRNVGKGRRKRAAGHKRWRCCAGFFWPRLREAFTGNARSPFLSLGIAFLPSFPAALGRCCPCPTPV